MANLKASLKDIRKTKTRSAYNHYWLNTMKNMVKRLRSAKSKEEAVKMLPALISRLGKMKKSKILHANKASHLKSNAAKFVNSLK